MRLDDYSWKGLPPDLVEWLDSCTKVINLGLYAQQVYASPPTAATISEAGNFGLAKDGASWYIFVYTGDDGWYKVKLTAI